FAGSPDRPPPGADPHGRDDLHRRRDRVYLDFEKRDHEPGSLIYLSCRSDWSPAIAALTFAAAPSRAAWAEAAPVSRRTSWVIRATSSSSPLWWGLVETNPGALPPGPGSYACRIHAARSWNIPRGIGGTSHSPGCPSRGTPRVSWNR